MTGDGLQRKLSEAVAFHQAGRLDDAERIYRQVLRRAPRNDDALHLLGVLCHQKGNHGEAECLVAEAVRIRPTVVAYYENLAVIQKALGNLAAVADTCRKGLAKSGSDRLAAELVEALLGLGQFRLVLDLFDEMDRRSPPTGSRLADRAHCQLQLGRLGEAARTAAESLALDAENGNARSVLAEVATRRGDYAGAAVHWREISQLHPDWSAAVVNLGLSLVRMGDGRAALAAFGSRPLPSDPAALAAMLNGRAAAHRQLRQLAEAAKCLRQALLIWPASAEYLNNLSELNRAADATRALLLVDRALVCDPLHAGARDNRGLALVELDRLEAAITEHRRAIALMPHDRAILNNLADPLRWFCLRVEAERQHRRSLAVDPGFAPAAYSLGTLQLADGNFAKGWIGYERRFDADPHLLARPFSKALWNGGPLTGKLLVWGEQGVGDELIYGSILPELPRVGIVAVVECDPRIVSIMARSMPEIVFVGRADPPDPRLEAGDVAAQIALGSLGRRFRRSLEDFHCPGGYLVPHPDLLEHWRRRLNALGPGPKIGFAWRSRRNDALARRFHPPILEWTPVLRQPGALFVSLQYGDFASDLELARSTPDVAIHQFADLDLFNDFEGVLALSAALDLVVSTGTTAFCPAAAAGTPVWLVTAASDHFMFGSSDRYPWFPETRVYAHPYASPWRTTIGRVATDLAGHLASSPLTTPENS